MDLSILTFEIQFLFHFLLQWCERWCVTQNRMDIVTLTLPLGYHGRNTVHGSIGNDVVLFLMPLDVLWSDLSWGPLWFSFVPVLCLAGLYTIVSLYLCKCSLYSCQSIICLQSTLWKKILYLYLLFFLLNIFCERYVYVYICVHMYTGIHTLSAFMWPMRAVEMLVPTSATSDKLIIILKAHCNIRPARDHLPIES